jgi:hypothetical protein
MLGNVGFQSGDTEQVHTVKHMFNLKMFILILCVFLQGCVSTTNLSQGDVIAKSAQCSCKGNSIVMTMVSYGPISDALMISKIKATGTDDGFCQDFSTLIQHDNKNFTLYSQSNQKLSAILINAFSKYEDNALEGVALCLVSMSDQYIETLQAEASRVGAKMEFVE